MPHSKVVHVAIISLIVFAAVTGCSPARNAPSFSENRAFDLLKQQVSLGPRYAGTNGHDLMVENLQKWLKPYAHEVRVQEFDYTIGSKKLEMHNIIASFNPTARKWVLLAAHWDSRPIADQEVDEAKRKQPILGANDGASGVAVLLELAQMLSVQKPDVGVLMVFFDGEDYGPGTNAMFLGAKYFASHLSDSLAVNGKQIEPEYGILLDMIGDKDLKIYQERNSSKAGPEVVAKVWKAAAALGYESSFIPEVGYTISDDHLPLIAAGIKCIDVIDFDYGPWHTLDDTVDKCSPESLKKVGDVIAAVIYQEKDP